MPKRPIKGCLCGEDGIGSSCYITKKGKCEWCGWNVNVHAGRIQKLKTNGLKKLRNGLWGIKLESWEVIS